MKMVHVQERVQLMGLGGFGATILSASSAQNFNKGTKSQKWGWKLSASGISKYGTAGSKDLAEDVYCFQHVMERGLKSEKDCSGECNPHKSAGNCYNRDGMIGNRTLELIGFMQYHGNKGSLATIEKNLDVKQSLSGFLGSFTMPDSYVKDYESFSAVSDAKEEVKNCEGDVGSYHCKIESGEEDSSIPSGFWAMTMFGIPMKIVVPLALLTGGVSLYFALKDGGMKKITPEQYEEENR